MKGDIISIREIAKDVKEFILRLDAPIRFIPGQYVMLCFEEKSRDRRAYSVVRYDAMARTINIIVKLGGVFTQRLFSIKVDSSASRILDGIPNSPEIFVYGPYGKFILKGNRKIVFIAGGIGIVPLYSMFINLLHTKSFNDVHFHYTCRYENEMALKDELEAIHIDNIHVKTYLTRDGLKERFSIESIKSLKNNKDYDYYICGPEQMMDEIILGLKGLDIQESNIHKESYIMRK